MNELTETQRKLLDFNEGGMCLFCVGDEWHVNAQPFARVTRANDGWTGETPEEAMEAAIEVLTEQKRL